MNNKEKIEIVKKMLSNQNSNKEIMEKVGYKTYSGLKSFCYRNNIVMSEFRNKKTIKKIFNEDFLKNEDVLYYFYGLVASDGTLDKNRKRIRITLKDLDMEILTKLKKELFVNHEEAKLYETIKSDSMKYISLHIENKKLYEECLKLGLTPNKTKTLKINYDNMSKKNISSFIRGYFDGDGSVSINQPFYIKKNGENLYIIKD